MSGLLAFARLCFCLVSVAIGAIIADSTAWASGLPRGLEVDLESVKASYSADDKVIVKITYTNKTDQDINLLVWGTALESVVTHDFLKVVYDGEELPYIGIHAKRLPPTQSSYRLIAAGASVSGQVDLSSSYDIVAKGQYSVAYADHELTVDGQARKSQAGIVLNITEDRIARVFKREPIIQSTCNATQRAQIEQALTIAERIAQTAARDLSAAPIDLRPNARRYLEWFGAYTPGRYDSVSRGMSRIASALSNNRIGFDCACDIDNRDRVFAFVFKNDPFNMNVCPVFFRVAPSGTDSRSGTIVHEISHFTVVADSDDFSSALDQRGSRALAINNPSSAIRNANAFEYFAENTPFLEMPAPVNEGDDGPDAPQPEPGPEPEPESETPIIAPILPILLDD